MSSSHEHRHQVPHPSRRTESSQLTVHHQQGRSGGGRGGSGSPLTVFPSVRVPYSYTTPTGPAEPVVAVLAGWWGADIKQLRRFVAMYTGAGAPVLAFVAPSRVLLSSRHTAALAADLLLFLSAKSPATPVVFHSFSNGGCLVYEAVVRAIATDSRFTHMKLKAAIFDSCPGTLSVSTGVGALMAGMPSRAWRIAAGGAIAIPPICLTLALRRVASTMLWGSSLRKRLLAASILLVVGYAVWRIGWRWWRHHPYWEVMRDNTLRHAELYLYSEADHLVAAKDIDELVEYRRKLGISIMAVKWRDSPHVAHLRNHPDEYIQAVLCCIGLAHRPAPSQAAAGTMSPASAPSASGAVTPST